jgi:branched-chain amino acid aminotransferase
MYYNEKTILFNNGKFLKASEATTDLYGQTLHYGYGVFEGIRSYETSKGAKIFKAKEHYERLQRSCELVHIPFEYSVEELTDISYKVLEKNNLADAYLRPLVYCDPNMSLNRPSKVNLMICAWDWGKYLGDKLLRLCISSYQRPNPKSVKVEAKVCGHYVNSILATVEAKDKGFDEGLLLDMHEHIAEGPGANFFCEKNGKLFTPPLGNILPGITRATVLELCKELGIPCEVRHLRPEELKDMDGAFFCGTAAEVIGIESIDNIPFRKKWNETQGAEIQKIYSALVCDKKYVSQLLEK